ncbi:MAG: GIY-YIG nuclease family protein [Rhizonema sp. NSF051]|nr:GIY-YIG nuclease family protein [Rhizonema sp. NSF051]
MHGYCYLIGEHLTGRYKIGKAKHPMRRLQQLQTGNPRRLGLGVIIKTDNMTQTESQLHSQYQHRRVDGEWFVLTGDDIAELKSFPGAW